MIDGVPDACSAGLLVRLFGTLDQWLRVARAKGQLHARGGAGAGAGPGGMAGGISLGDATHSDGGIGGGAGGGGNAFHTGSPLHPSNSTSPVSGGGSGGGGGGMSGYGVSGVGALGLGVTETLTAYVRCLAKFSTAPEVLVPALSLFAGRSVTSLQTIPHHAMPLRTTPH